MTETLFAFDEDNYRDCQAAYRGEREQEYYLGDYRIEGGGEIDVRAEREAVGACSILRLRSRNRLTFKRSWSHIREDATDVVVLWFLRHGRLRIAHSGSSSVAGPGDFALTRSMQPFTIECETDAQGRHEVLHVVVPAHLFRQVLPAELQSGLTVPAGERALALAEGVLDNLLRHGNAGGTEQRRALLDSALAVVAQVLGARDDCLQVRRSLREERLQEVLRYIDVHLSDPNLSAAVVARGCGISPRYLSALLQEHGTPFPDLVWGQRVEAAGRWLASTKPEDISIAEIAFRVGFKSPAHFSRMFKRVYRQGPRDYRSACLRERAQPTPTDAARGGLYLASISKEPSKEMKANEH